MNIYEHIAATAGCIIAVVIASLCVWFCIATIVEQFDLWKRWVKKVEDEEIRKAFESGREVGYREGRRITNDTTENSPR